MSRQDQTLPPWVQGPFELIRHANEHLKLAGDSDRRITLIGFDNAIEICIDVFINLHPKVRGGFEITNDAIEKAGRNYHTKLEFFYNYAKEKGILVEIPIEDVIWYHQLRNQLYHSGHGLIPEIHTLFGAKAAALVIFKSLFNLDITPLLDKSTTANEIDNRDLGNWLGENVGDLREAGIKPPREAGLVRDTLRSQGHLLLMQAERDRNRFYRACNVPNLGYGIQVVQWNEKEVGWQEITSFLTPKIRQLERLKEHLRRLGGIEYQGELPKPILV